MNDFNFEPINGLNDTTQFPTNPGSEAAARNQFMILFNQIKNYINENILPKINVNTRTYTEGNSWQKVEKWNDGKMRITIRHSFTTSISEAWGSMYNGSASGPNFKEPFASNPDLISVTPAYSSGWHPFLVAVGGNAAKDSAQSITITRPTSVPSQEFRVVYIYEGRWK